MPLRVYSTLSREKKEFSPLQPGKVGMYLCGPTVYKPSHVGHMVGPVIFDTVKRYLVYLGYEVRFAVNITDVDDKLIKQAALEKTTVGALAERVTVDYVANLKRLGVASIDAMPKVSEHIPDIVASIGGLIDKGFAYPASGDVYFDISKDDDYGKLCRRDPEQMAAGARIEVSEKKRNPGDFALWKAAKPGEPAWDSPWGKGRPGWHIECSAMALKLLGATLDIHGGGLDLTFPHHENELAQSESLTGKPFANYWMHNGLMRIRSQSSKIKDGVPGEGSEKMSKSLGNEIVVSELFKRHEPETLRLLLLATHYRSPIEYSEERLAELRRGLEGFYRLFERYQRIVGPSFYEITYPQRESEFNLSSQGSSDELSGFLALRRRFLEYMDDDFNTGGAVGVLHELLNALNRFGDNHRLEYPNPPQERLREFQEGCTILRSLGHILGLFQRPAPKTNVLPPKPYITPPEDRPQESGVGLRTLSPHLAAERVPPPEPTTVRGQDPPLEAGRIIVSTSPQPDQLTSQLLQLLIDLRNNLRAEGKKLDKADPVRKMLFDQTDVIRARLGEIGVTLEDRPGGTGWRIG